MSRASRRQTELTERLVAEAGDAKSISKASAAFLPVQSSSDQQRASKSASIVAKAKLLNPEKIHEYLAILQEMAEFCHNNFKGHLYSRILENGVGGYVSSVHRFDSMENLKVWAASEKRESLVNRLKDLAVPGSFNVDVAEGATQWLQVPESADSDGKKNINPRPPQWKIVIIIILVFYPLVLLLSFTLDTHLASEGYSALTTYAINIAIVLPLSSYLFTPLLSRALKKWLSLPRSYSKHSLMYILDSGFTIFRPNSLSDSINSAEVSIIKRLVVAEQFIISLQDRIRLLESDRTKNSALDFSYIQIMDDKIEEFIAPKIVNSLEESSDTDSVAYKILIKISSSFMRTYENYLEDVGNAASKFEGFLGFDVVGPSRIDAQGNATYILMSRFQKRSQLLVWISSKERKDLYRKVLPYITVVSGDIDSSEKPFFSHGFDSLFLKETKSNPAEKADLPAPPPKYKTVILTYCILNVNAAFIRTVIAPFYPSFFPGPVSLLITLVLNVTITSYLSNPMLNKLFQDWIHSYTMKDIPKSTIGRILHLGIPGL